MSNKFIDISEHNTILSLNAIGQCNLKGCIMKATEGTTYFDNAMETLYAGISGQLPIGFYHYLTITSEPETQAQSFWNRIKDKSYQIVPVLDVEQEKLSYNAQSYSERFMEEFYKLSGQHMIIYSGRYYISENFDITFRNNNVWWVADYDASVSPTILGCRVVGWQYTENCQDYAFNNGDLDCSILFDEELFYLDSANVTTSETINSVSDSNISTLQTELNNQGFTDKNGNNIVVDGIAGELTLSACPMLKTGVTGLITQWVQMNVGVSADGAFGEETRQAIITFQENMSLDGDGIVGTNTWRKLLGL